MRLRRLAQEALKLGEFTPELEKARAENDPEFTHFLDLPMLFLIITLGALKSDNWGVFIVDSLAAIALVVALTLFIPRLIPGRQTNKPLSHPNSPS